MQKDTLLAHLRRHYGIYGEIHPIAKGRAANFLVVADAGRWLFKIFQESYTHARVLQAADFVAFVAGAGYPTRNWVNTVDGQKTATLNNRVTALIPWIDGVTPEANDASSPAALQQIGALCGRIHCLGDAYPLRHQLPYAGSRRTLAEKRSALLRLPLNQSGEPVARDVGVRLAILDELGEALEESQRAARPGVIHGDFMAAHVVFADAKAVGVIDVIGELYLPGWELMRAFFQSVPFDPAAEAPLLDRWRAYVEGYTSARQIGAHEIEIAYDVYLLQLVSSTYGLRPPLDAELRAFGRWRTSVAKYLAERRAGLRPMMGGVIPAPSSPGSC